MHNPTVASATDRQKAREQMQRMADEGAEHLRAAAHYSGLVEQLEAERERQLEAFYDLVEFVESHGGSLSGEARGELYRLALEVR